MRDRKVLIIDTGRLTAVYDVNALPVHNKVFSNLPGDNTVSVLVVAL